MEVTLQQPHAYKSPVSSPNLPIDGSAIVARLWSQDGLREVESLMHALSDGADADRCSLMLREHLSTGGKRIRARLALTAFEALGGSREAGIAWAAACELVHNATLIHDDVQDGDRARRGVPTTWVRHGIPQAINAGDLLLLLPFTAVEHLPVPHDVRWLLSQAIAHRAASTVRGQSREMELRELWQVDIDHFLRALAGKTGALIALPVEGAALMAGLPSQQVRQLAHEFISLGILFQLQDDVLDLFGDKGRDERGADIREGKISALVVEHLALHPEDEPWLKAILLTPRELTTDQDVDDVIRRFEEGGALKATLERIARLKNAVLQAPILQAHPLLLAVARALVDLTLAPIAHLEFPTAEGVRS